MITCDCPCHRQPPSHAIYGGIELANGIISNWLEFIDGNLTVEAAKAEAVRIKEAIWKGCVVRCWAN